jgi:hypothetical protein
VWDVGGQEKLRPLWRHYFNNTGGCFTRGAECGLQVLLQAAQLQYTPQWVHVHRAASRCSMLIVALPAS